MMKLAQSTLLKSHKARFIDAVKFLKTTKIKKETGNDSLHKAPWVLVIGSKGSGKTSLIANSEIHFNLAKKQEQIAQHEEINWWVSKTVIYLDTPDNYLSEPQIFAHYLKLIKKYSFQHQINALILTTSLTDLLSTDEQEIAQRYNHFSSLLRQVQKTLDKHCPIYVVINKVDLLTGFNEFFHNYSKDERQQPWGITFTSTSSNLPAQFEHEFEELTQRLNQQVIWRLHHEPDLSKRALIKDFPLQFSKIKTNLVSFLHQLVTANTNLNIKGLYFSSALQLPLLQSTYQSSETLLAIRKEPQTKSYFIHDLFNQIIPNTLIQKKSSYFTNTLFMISYGIILILFAGLIIFFTINFEKNATAYQQVTLTLTKFKLSINSKKTNFKQTAKLLTSLNRLKNASSQLNAPTWQKVLPGGIKSTQLQQQINQLYQNEITETLTPNIKQSLETILQQPNTTPTMLYLALEAYVMLADPTNFNSQQFISLMQTIWRTTLTTQPTLQNVLNKQLTNFLAEHHSLATPVNYSLITNARTTLSQLSPTQMAFIILKASLPGTKLLTLNFKTDANAAVIFTFKNSELGLSTFYTPETLAILNNGLFSKAAQTVIAGNNVINGNPSIPLPILTSELQQLYYKNYAKHWQKFMTNLVFNQPTNLSSLEQMLALLGSDHSPLLQLSSLISSQVPANVLSLSPLLTNLASLNSLNSALTQSFSNLYNYILPANSPEQAFKLASARFLNNGINDPITATLSLATELPDPARFWVYQLASNSWQFIITATQNYLQSQWQTLVWPTYNNQIANRYPFNNTASNNVALESFINFFAPNSLLDSFFNNYLRVFIDTTKKPWHPKALQGQSMAVKNNILAAIIQEQSLQNIFFPDHDQHLYISFTLQAEKFSNNLRNIQFQLGAQSVNFSPYQTSTPQAFTWPDATDSTSFKINFIDSSNQTESLIYTNPWALWQFFSATNLTPSTPSPNASSSTTQVTPTNTNNYWNGMIVKDSSALQFQLTTQQKLNPFDSNLFANFNLTESIFD